MAGLVGRMRSQVRASESFKAAYPEEGEGKEEKNKTLGEGDVAESNRTIRAISPMGRRDSLKEMLERRKSMGIIEEQGDKKKLQSEVHSPTERKISSAVLDEQTSVSPMDRRRSFLERRQSEVHSPTERKLSSAVLDDQTSVSPMDRRRSFLERRQSEVHSPTERKLNWAAPMERKLSSAVLDEQTSVSPMDRRRSFLDRRDQPDQVSSPGLRLVKKDSWLSRERSSFAKELVDTPSPENSPVQGENEKDPSPVRSSRFSPDPKKDPSPVRSSRFSPDPKKDPSPVRSNRFSPDPKKERPGVNGKDDVIMQLPTCRRSDFEMGAKLGEGSFATVHKGKHLATGKDVAIKIVKPEKDLDFGGDNPSACHISYKDVLKAMKKEVEFIERVGVHPHIVELMGTSDNCQVFIMEKATSDLYQIVRKKEKTLSLQSVSVWSEQILQAIDFIHQKDIVHQDIKSSNVLIFNDRQCKICDFGLARSNEDVMYVDRELVTLWYRAPELLLGDTTYTKKIDDWSAGCILLEMIIGICPFRGNAENICNCPQVTHRNFNSDQLIKIFKMLGSPEEKYVKKLSCHIHMKGWPTMQSKLSNMVSMSITKERCPPDIARNEGDLRETKNDWLQLLQGLLYINPHERLSCKESLESPLFQGKGAGRRQNSPFGRKQSERPFDLARRDEEGGNNSAMRPGSAQRPHMAEEELRSMSLSPVRRVASPPGRTSSSHVVNGRELTTASSQSPNNFKRLMQRARTPSPIRNQPVSREHMMKFSRPVNATSKLESSYTIPRTCEVPADSSPADPIEHKELARGYLLKGRHKAL